MRILTGLWILGLALTQISCQTAQPKFIAPFTTDGCSDFPDGTFKHKDLWHKCCTAHDLKYWAGGSYDERMQADLELRACVKTVDKPVIADIMLAGVRVGGSPCWPTSFRWGYGWPFANGYNVLTKEELEQVRRQKEKQGLN